MLDIVHKEDFSYLDGIFTSNSIQDSLSSPLDNLKITWTLLRDLVTKSLDNLWIKFTQES